MAPAPLCTQFTHERALQEVRDEVKQQRVRSCGALGWAARALTGSVPCCRPRPERNLRCVRRAGRPLRGLRASPQRQEALERTFYASLYDEEDEEAQERGDDDSVKKKGGLSLMVQSGLCYTFELRLDRWQGMAESSDAETVLQAITEMARVRGLLETAGRSVSRNTAALCVHRTRK